MLTRKQIEQYDRNGFIAPIDIFQSNQITTIKKEIEIAEGIWKKELSGIGRNNAHYVLPILDKIAHDEKILDAVESLIGHDILIAGTTLFIKDGKTKDFVSWHQDARYIGFEPHNWVTAWLAVSDANEENGCMRMIPGSHLNPLNEHIDTFDKNNILTRGQKVPGIRLNSGTPVILKAGQLSLHHPRVIHSSGPNLTSSRRIGFAIQSYIGSNVEQVIGKVWVLQARGQNCGHHKHAKRPTISMAKKDLDFRKLANKELSKIFYSGAKKKEYIRIYFWPRQPNTKT